MNATSELLLASQAGDLQFVKVWCQQNVLDQSLHITGKSMSNKTVSHTQLNSTTNVEMEMEMEIEFEMEGQMENETESQQQNTHSDMKFPQSAIQEAFEVACRNNHIPIVQFLCKHFSKIDLNPIFSYKYIFYYCQPSYHALTQFLLQQKPLPEYTLVHNKELLYTIVNKNDAHTLQSFLSLVPASWKHQIVDVFSLEMATEKGFNVIVEILLESISPWVDIHENKASLLFNALHSQDLATIQAVCSSKYTRNEDLYQMSELDMGDILEELFCAQKCDILMYLHKTFDNTKDDYENFQFNEMTFVIACEYGNIEFLCWLLHHKPTIDLSYLNEMGFRRACSGGHLKLAKWFLLANPDTDIGASNHGAFAGACRCGHLSMAKWLWTFVNDELVHPDHTTTVNSIVLNCIKNAAASSLLHHKCLTVLDWLLAVLPSVNLSCYEFDGFKHIVQTQQPKLLSWYLTHHPTFDTSMNDGSPFKLLCHYGNINLLKTFIAIRPTYDVTYDNNAGFMEAVESGHLNVCQWLCSTIQSTKAVSHPLVLTDKHFNVCCSTANRELLKWMWSFVGVQENETRTTTTVCRLVTFDMFREACASGDLDFVRWCFARKMDSWDLSEYDNILFRDAAQLDCLPIMQFLKTQKPDMDITANNHEAFKAVCTQGRSSQAAVWLQSLHRDYHLTLERYWEDGQQLSRVVSFSIHRKLVIKGDVKVHRSASAPLHESKCPICIVNDVSVKTDCGHCFCISCLRKTLRITDSKVCPLCRTDFNFCNTIQWITEE